MSATVLPLELCTVVETYLTNGDIKSLRLTCRDFSTKFHLRLKRVFLSANPLNVHVFRSIAEHETFRHGIVEVIWDDARLIEGLSHVELRRIEADLTDSEDNSDEDKEEEERGEYDGDNHAPRWYKALCRQNLSDLESRGWRQRERLGHQNRMRQVAAQLPCDEAWKYYRGLLRQQQKVLSSDADAEAFRYGLSRFPALRKVTVTPATHGFLFAPLYETPMIRAFPYGFNYPIPSGWPRQRDFERPYYIKPWDDEERQKWRGVCIVLRELADKQEHHVVEFLIDSNRLSTGLNCRIFDRPCQDYENFKTLLSRPGFQHLTLSLLADTEEDDWGSLRNGRLYAALSEATELEHLDFRFQIDAEQNIELGSLPTLCTMLPVERWPKLKQFGLTRAIVAHDDLISVLQVLPHTLRSIELSRLRFVDECREPGTSQGWRGLLRRLRKDLDWRTRPPNKRPCIAVHINSQIEMLSRYICLDKGVSDYVYGDGENPFGLPGEEPVRTLGALMGVVRDPLEPDYESPE